MKTLRALGRWNAIDSALTASVSCLGRLVIGIFAGFPNEALYISSAISTALSAVAELPSGILTDIWGRKKGIALGYLLQASASICIALAILNRTNSWALFFIVLEAILDAIGNSLLSGTKESIMHEVASKDLSMSDSEKLFLVIESYSRWISFFVPLLALGVLKILIGISVESAFWVFLVLAIGWASLAHRSFYLCEEHRLQAHIESDENWDFRKAIRTLRQQVQMKGRSFSFFFLISLFAFILAIAFDSFFTVNVLRDFGNPLGHSVWIHAFLLLFASLLGTLLRSYINALLSKHWPNSKIIVFGALGLVGVGALSLLSNKGHLLAVYIPSFVLFQIFVAMVGRSSLGSLLTLCDSRVHTSLISARSAIGLWIVGASSALVAKGEITINSDKLLALSGLVGILTLLLESALSAEKKSK